MLIEGTDMIQIRRKKRFQDKDWEFTCRKIGVSTDHIFSISFSKMDKEYGLLTLYGFHFYANRFEEVIEPPVESLAEWL